MKSQVSLWYQICSLGTKPKIQSNFLLLSYSNLMKNWSAGVPPPLNRVNSCPIFEKSFNRYVGKVNVQNKRISQNDKKKSYCFFFASILFFNKNLGVIGGHRGHFLYFKDLKKFLRLLKGHPPKKKIKIDQKVSKTLN